ncbi:hypothetical protein HAX54_037489 [Datura stramonium]|uniref:Uncharacterized protein n=1 Tax=Datura stramonium TaxID=4076 RepID=A0ABS8VLM1_DATST|nr:hypothetical protein [Datura stramonium]
MEKNPPKGSRSSNKRLKSSSPSPTHVEISESSSNECPESASSLLKKPSSFVPKKINWLEWILGFMLESCHDPDDNTSLPYGMIVTWIIKTMGVDVSSFPVKGISSTYNDRAFYSMSYVLHEGVWVKKTSYKPKVKLASAEGPSSVRFDDAQGAVLNSLLSEAQEIKKSLDAVVGDLHKCTELLGKLSTDMTSLQAQLSLIQREGVKPFNLFLMQVDSVAS